MADNKEMAEYLESCSVPESNLIENLCSSSRAFNDFYSNERKKIKSPITWQHNKKLRPEDQILSGELAEMRISTNGDVCIIIHNYPAKENDASTIAHELAHAIMREDGYPFIGHYRGCSDPEVIHLCKQFNEMIHDPLILKKILLNYDFNLQNEYSKDCADGITALIKENKSGIERIRVTFFFTQLLLEQDLIFENETNPCFEYIQKLGEEYPDIMDRSNAIYKMIKTLGIDLPEQVGDIIKTVIEMHHGLSDIVEIY